MGMDKSEILFEKERLHKALCLIKDQLKGEQESLDKFKDSIITTQKKMWEDITLAPSDPWDLDGVAQAWAVQVEIERQGRAHVLSKKISGRLEKMYSSPYFGRIDFREDGEATESIYIGIANLMGENSGECLIYDWRAPISSMFYDYELGKASYKCPTCLVEGDLILKRQYRIWKGKIEYMFDSSIKIDDEILQEVLSRSADTRMKAIVITIQREQNRVIRDEGHKLLMVYGPAGSGKTSIALHRIAYLLYKYRDTIKPENIVIFSPNQIFNDYISGVLPELGEENMYETTFMEYARKSMGPKVKMEDMNSQMECLLTGRFSPQYESRVKGIEYKSSKAFEGVLKNYLKYLKERDPGFEDITYRENTIITADELLELLKEGYGYLPLSRRLDKIRRRVLYLLEPLEKERYKEAKRELEKSDEYFTKGEFFERCRDIVKGEFGPMKDKLHRVTVFDILKVYRELFEDRELFRSMCVGSLPVSFESIRLDTLESIDSNNIYFEDVAPIMYLNGELCGSPDTFSIKHVVIDEVQDYTPLQLEVMNGLFPTSCLTLLGDPNQSINPYMNRGQSNGTYVFEGSRAVIKLGKSYRSTREITAFSRAILKEDERAGCMDRCGEKPVVKRVNGEEALFWAVLEDVQFMKEKGYKSIGIICRTAADGRSLYNNIKDSCDVRLISRDDDEFTAGSVIVPSYLAKGLEFDSVLAAGADSYQAEDERKLFYTVCTRALHQLVIYSSGDLSPFIRDINKDLYETETSMTLRKNRFL